ncbi:response regulator transcription factor [Pontibacter actiniarum]|uniref:DNA-binding response regulator n=1 Tax=Pontibacter actiniarum TaxID=323450 RepID=A0A1X9YSB6_9BACT|nr:response regulator transcription factor [Pontibacter actiniarum]ARS35758.1 DNA-binding response regulator [Pontibacter actiniarum]
MTTTKVALVDDHRLFRKGLLELINGFSDYTVTLEADNGKDLTHKLFPEKIPDIVLLDISMPVMNGYETAAWLQAHHPSIKILALSMGQEEETILRMLRCGINGYLLKTADPSELRMALDALLVNGSYYAGSVSEVLKKDLQGERLTLTERELQVLRLACTELPYKAIAAELHLSPRAVETAREHLFQKLQVSSRVGLAVYAITHGLYQPE